MKLVPVDPPAGARLLRPGGIRIRRLSWSILLSWIAVGVEQRGIHHEMFPSYHASLNQPVYSLIEDPFEDMFGSVVLEPGEGGLVWNLVEAQPPPPRWMLSQEVD